MIGNDIVDLQFAKKQSDWRRKGWLQKIFTTIEQEYIVSSKDPNLTVWKLWSMKEAVYKAHQRYLRLSPKFNPKDFECMLGGKVNVGGYRYSTNSEITQQYIYTVVKPSRNGYYSSVCNKDINVYHALERCICQGLKIIAPISIQKDANRIPAIYIDNKESNILVSLTHHGAYSAFMFSIENEISIT